VDKRAKDKGAKDKGAKDKGAIKQPSERPSRQPASQQRPPASEGSRRTEGATEDLDLFAREMRDVRPIAHDRARLPVTPAAPVTAGGRRPGSAAGPPPLRQLDSGPELWGYLAHDAGPPLLRELRTGGRRPEASLDLHGLTADEAARALEVFVRQAQADRRRVVLIIHGRGRGSGAAGPVLGDLVRERLASGKTAACILALSSAPPALGGAGAMLILLRKM
jgi:DNA-nicking Smr family endonuclease